MLSDSWKKSSYSTANGDCVEFRTSSHSGGTNCVEFRNSGLVTIQVRDSKDKAGPVLSFTRAEWAEFVAGLKAGS